MASGWGFPLRQNEITTELKFSGISQYFSDLSADRPGSAGSSDTPAILPGGHTRGSEHLFGFGSAYQG